MTRLSDRDGCLSWSLISEWGQQATLLRWLDILIEALEAVTCADRDVVWTNGTEYTWSAAMRGRQLYSRYLRKAMMRARIAASGVNTEIKPLKALQPTSSKPTAMFAGC